MELRSELMPPALDETLVARLAKLAAAIDGARPGQWEEHLAEFNRLAHTAIPFADFQGIYGGEEHEDWIRKLLYQKSLTADPNLARAEMVEIVSRVMAGGKDHEFFLELFLVNCKHPSGSDLIFWPRMVPEFSGNHQPSAEEIADLVMRGRA
jgi:hypothetical protein